MRSVQYLIALRLVLPLSARGAHSVAADVATRVVYRSRLVLWTWDVRRSVIKIREPASSNSPVASGPANGSSGCRHYQRLGKAGSAKA